jgi:hypothetical protein
VPEGLSVRLGVPRAGGAADSRGGIYLSCMHSAGGDDAASAPDPERKRAHGQPAAPSGPADGEAPPDTAAAAAPSSPSRRTDAAAGAPEGPSAPASVFSAGETETATWLLAQVLAAGQLFYLSRAAHRIDPHNRVGPLGDEGASSSLVAKFFRLKNLDVWVEMGC